MPEEVPVERKLPDEAQTAALLAGDLSAAVAVAAGAAPGTASELGTDAIPGEMPATGDHVPSAPLAEPPLEKPQES